jgi:hypothetical protein
LSFFRMPIIGNKNIQNYALSRQNLRNILLFVTTLEALLNEHSKYNNNVEKLFKVWIFLGRNGPEIITLKKLFRVFLHLLLKDTTSKKIQFLFSLQILISQERKQRTNLEWYCFTILQRFQILVMFVSMII